MDVTYAALSTTGPVRGNNEDFVSFWQPEDADEKLRRGVIVALADGVGGHGHGEVASRLAVETALKTFQELSNDVPLRQALSSMFTQANTAVYDEGMKESRGGRMSTTLTISLLRNNELAIGHVGDCRSYLIRGGVIRCLTADHSYAGMQQKMGLLTKEEAQVSELRSVLTRSIGPELMLSPDIDVHLVAKDDLVVQCCDGVHGVLSDEDIAEAAVLYKPPDACKFLIRLAERKGAQDNISVQIVRIDRVYPVAYHRGLPYHIKGAAATMGHEVEVGHVLDGRFEITDVISRSGMASIFKATDLETKKTVAVKVPLMQYESDPAFYSRFEREEEIGKTLDHPFILHIIPMEKKSRPYIAMEYLEGQTLGQLLRSVKPLPQHDAVTIASRLADALDYMHRRRMNVIHRDLKPDNIMLCNDGTLRIMDFGIAKVTGLRRITFAGFSPTMGTPDYMAPEQVKGQRGDERTDIYSLGAILYELVTGKAPFEGDSAYAIMNVRLVSDPIAPRKINPNVSPQIEEIILHAMARNPNERYASAAEMKQELDNQEKVQLTGRHERLKQAKPGEAGLRANRLLIAALVIPVVILIIFMLMYPHGH
jgi:serine/threonine protein phosphatase PrpC